MRSNLEILLGITGLLLSLTMFFATTSTTVYNNLIAVSPIALVGFYFIWKLFEKSNLSLSVAQALKTFRHHNSLRCESSMTVRVLNEKGDVAYKRTFKHYLTKNYEFAQTPEESLYTGNRIENLTFQTIVSDSLPEGIQMEKKIIEQPKDKVGKVEHFWYGWYYILSPTLTKKNDFVEYKYEINLQGEEAKAFTDEGALLFFVAKKGYSKATCCLIAPPRYEIEVLKYYVKSNRIEIKQGINSPSLSLNGQILEWSPKLKDNARYVVNYRLKLLEGEV